mgnify:CR=1 FL=1
MHGDPVWGLFLTNVLSHAAMLPALLQLIKRGWMYEVSIACFSLVTSLMYHSCETFQTSFFLSELQWHRLDNIAAIAVFGTFFVYLCHFDNVYAETFTKHIVFFVTMVLQEKSPWDVNFTIAPIVVCGTLPIIVHTMTHQRLPQYDWKAFTLGFGILGAALPFFAMGLDENNDPWRAFHGMWHLLVGVANIYLWRIVKNPQATMYQSPLTSRNKAEDWDR